MRSRLENLEAYVRALEFAAGIEMDRDSEVLRRRKDGFCADGRRLGI